MVTLTTTPESDDLQKSINYDSYFCLNNLLQNSRTHVYSKQDLNKVSSSAHCHKLDTLRTLVEEYKMTHGI